jgi:hypothetical protein
MEKSIRKFQYINAYGIKKQLNVYEMVNNKYPVELWATRYGEYCGSGEMTKQELNDYLEHFGITERME